MNSETEPPTQPPSQPQADGAAPTPTVTSDAATAAPRTSGVSDGGPGGFATLPATFGRYRVEQRVGVGGMGAVYRAHDTQLDRPVALKIPLFSATDGPNVRERFLREARAAATVHHAHICPVYDVGELDGTLYLTMGFIEGRSLAETLRAQAVPLKPRTIAILMRKLAQALDEAHRRYVIHRDLKPANIMITRRGEPVIMDFGLARRGNSSDARITQLGSLMGTPAYMAPEQARGNPDEMGPSCDIYSLGVILYELLAGRRPFEGDPIAILAQLMSEEPVPPSQRRPGVDPALEAIARKAMAKTVADRYPSMNALVADLTDYLKASDAPAPPRTLTTAAAQPTAVKTQMDPRPRAETRARPAPPTPRDQRPARRVQVHAWVYAAVASGALVLAVAVVGALGLGWFYATNEGTVPLTLSDPAANVEVRIDGQLVTLTPPATVLRLAPGTHALEVRGTGYRTLTPSFVVIRGANPPLHVPLEAVAQAPPAAAPPEKSSPPTPALKPPAPRPLTERAKEFVLLLSKGEFNQATGSFTPSLLKAVPPAELQRSWANLLAAAGPFKGVGGIRTEDTGKSVLVHVDCVFTKSTWEARLGFDAEGQIKGVVLQPKPTAPPMPAVPVPPIAGPPPPAPGESYVWPAAALREGKIHTPKFNAGAALYRDRFNHPRGGLPEAKTPTVERGYRNGKYVVLLHTAGTDTVELPFGAGEPKSSDFALEVAASAAGVVTYWGVIIADRDNPATAPVTLMIMGNGKLSLVEPQKKKEAGALRHVAINEAVKGGEARNVLQVLVKGRYLETYVNGSAVIDPITLARPLASPRVSLHVGTTRPKNTPIEFDSLTIWPAATIPSLEMRGALPRKQDADAK